MRAAIRFCLCLALASPAFSQGAKSVFLEELTTTEVRDAVRDGSTTIIVPIGGTEQNGPHVVLGKHNTRARILAGRIAERLGHTLVAPVLAYVPEGSIEPPTQHMRSAGTITIPERTFEEILVSAGRSFRAHGFRDVVFIGDHGGYQAAMKKAADSLSRHWAATPARAHAIVEYYRAADVEFVKMLRDKGLTPEEIGTHAGAADTSLSLAVDPALVRAEALPGSKATAELGRLGADLIVERSADAIRKAVARR